MSNPVALLSLYLAFAVGLSSNLVSQAQLTFTIVDVSGARQTVISDIDGFGDIVGFFVDSSGVTHGFRKRLGSANSATGAFTQPINVPGSTGTWATGIDLNHIFVVGWYTDSNSIPHGFELASGKFTTVDVPGAMWTRALSVNSSGTIVGAYADSGGKIHGFLDDHGQGTFTPLDYPGATQTEINHIVNLRYMAGSFVDSSGVEHGVQGAAGILGSAIDFPGAGLTSANGVNDAVNIAGYYGSPGGPFHGYSLIGGQFQTVDFPGATDTRCNSINDSLEIVGQYTDSTGRVHGFIAK